MTQVEEEALNHILMKTLHQTLRKLSPEEQDLLHRLYVEALTEQQIAEIDHLSQQAVHMRKVRLLRKLKKHLKNFAF